MKHITLLIITVLFAFKSNANPNEPCKEMEMPTDINSKVMVFELPTYPEYIRDIAIESMKNGTSVEDKNILEEEVFNEIRSEKVKMIKEVYTNPYTILTKAQAKSFLINASSAYVIREKFVHQRVSQRSEKYALFTIFTLSDTKGLKDYTIADPTNSTYTECILGKKQLKYDLMLEMLLN